MSQFQVLFQALLLVAMSVVVGKWIKIYKTCRKSLLRLILKTTFYGFKTTLQVSGFFQCWTVNIKDDSIYRVVADQLFTLIPVVERSC